MRMTRLALLACCAVPALPAWPQGGKPPGCEIKPADCVATLPVFDFGRRAMDPAAPPIHGHNAVSVTCTRSPQAHGRIVDVTYTLKAEPAEPTRSMRSRDGGYLRYFLFLDPARTRHWGDGIQFGTFAIEGALILDDRHRVGTRVHPVFGTVDGHQLVQPAPMLGAVVNRLEYRAGCR